MKSVPEYLMSLWVLRMNRSHWPLARPNRLEHELSVPLDQRGIPKERRQPE